MFLPTSPSPPSAITRSTSAIKGLSVGGGERQAATRRPSRSRQLRTWATSSSVGSTSGSRWPPTSCPSKRSAALIAIGFVCTFSSSYAGASDPSSSRARSRSPVERRLHLLGDLRPDDVRVHADPADAAELQEGLDQVVVAGVQVEPGRRRCAAPASRSSFACLTARTVSISARRLIVSGSMLTTTRDGNVVDDDRKIADRGDRLEVRDDAALRRLVVVRRDDQESVDAELVRLLGEVDGMRGRVRARARDDRCLLADRLERSAEEIEPLGIGERRALAGRPGDDDPVGAVGDEVPREVLERVEVDRAVVAGTASRSRSGRCRACDEILRAGGFYFPVPNAQVRPASSWPRHSPRNVGKSCSVHRQAERAAARGRTRASRTRGTSGCATARSRRRSACRVAAAPTALA